MLCMNKPSTDKSCHFEAILIFIGDWVSVVLIFYHRALLGSLCRRYIEVIWTQGRMGHAKVTCEGRVSVVRLGHFCHPPGFYLGFTVYSQVAEGPSFLEGSGGMAPRKFFEMNTR